MGKITHKIILLTLLLSLVFGLVFTETKSNICMKTGESSFLQTLSTTNPNDPDILLADIEVFDGYLTDYDKSYYYKTGAITSNYGVIWLNPYTTDDNWDIYIYTDSGYSTLLDSSAVGGDGEIEWVVIKRGAETDYYTRVWVPIDNGGTGYIEYDTALVCGRGQAKGNDHLDTSDSIELYYIYLDSTKTYDLSLTVPATGDFDLYLYYLESSISADPTEYLENSTTVGVGTDEAILNYVPPQSGTYVVLIVRASGDGTFSFLYDYAEATGGIPGFAVLGTLVGLAVVLSLKYKYYLSSRGQEKY